MRFYAAQEGKVVNILPPQSASGATSDIFSLRNHNDASIVIQQGDVTSGVPVTVKRSSDFSSTSTTAITFSYFAEETSNGDTLSVKQTASAGGFTTTSNSATFYVIEVDGAEMTSSCANLLVEFGAASATISAVAVLSGARYASASGPTTIV